MKISIPLLLAFAASAAAERVTTNTRSSVVEKDAAARELKKKGKKGSRSSEKTLTLTVTNQAFDQPFSEVFVMVHNSRTPLIYRRGQPPSSELARLAEDGNPAPLVDFYTENDRGVGSVFAFADGAPFFGGASFDIEVQVSDKYPLVTIATMAINTNDCFMSINGAALMPGMVLDLPGLDSGSEENNESCTSMPGPACAGINGNNEESGNGEGFVHVHRGFFGIGDLPANIYDWRNPMMRVVVRY